MSTAQLMPYFIQKFLDLNGNPLVSGNLFTYAAGTTTPQATYTDETAVTPNTNPVVLDSTGSASVWLGPLAYKFILKDSSGNLIRTVDNVSIINPGSIDNTKISANIAGVGLAQNNGTLALDVQVDNLTTEISGNEVIVKSGGIGTSQLAAGAVTIPKLSNATEMVSKYVRDYSCPGLFELIPQFEWSSPALISNPTTLPPDTSRVARWSPNGEFLAVGSNSANFLLIYQMVGGILTKLADPGTVPGGQVDDLTWSPCGDFLAVGSQLTSPYVFLYQRVGNTFTKLSDPASIPANSSGSHHPVVQFISFSQNSDFLILFYSVLTVGNFIIVYERSGITFTDITSTSTLSGIKGPFRWSPNSYLLAALDSSNSGIDVFARADNIFTAVSAPDVGAYEGDITDFAFSPDGNFFAVSVSISPYVLIFQITNSTTFTQLPNPGTLPNSAASCIAWSANSEYLLVGEANTPFMTIYQISGTTFTKIADVGTPPADAISTADWTSTKEFLAVATDVTPYIQVYKTASAANSNGVLWIRQVPGV